MADGAMGDNEMMGLLEKAEAVENNHAEAGSNMEANEAGNIALLERHESTLAGENTNQEQAPPEPKAEVKEQVPAADTSQPPKGGEETQNTPQELSIAEFAKQKGISDEKIVKLFNLIEQGGDLNGFLKGVAEDIDTLPKEERFKRAVYEKFSHLSDEDKAAIYEDEKDRYRLDSDLFDEEATRRGMIRFEAEYKDILSNLKQKQIDSAFTNATAQKNATLDNAAEIQTYIKNLQSSDTYKGISSTKTLKVGGDDETGFNMDVDVEKAVAFLTDPEAYEKAYMGEDGNHDFKKQMRYAAYATDPDGFERKLIEHGRKLATLELAKDLGNERIPGASAGVTVDSEKAELISMAKEALSGY